MSLTMLSFSALKAQHDADSLAIRDIVREQVSSWNRGDAEAYAKHFAESGTFTNIRGMYLTGHKQFLDRHAEIFKGMFLKTVMQQDVVSFRFLSQAIAIVETLTEITGFPKDGAPKGLYIDSKGRLQTRLLQVFQKESGDWKILVYHNVDVKSELPAPGH